MGGLKCSVCTKQFHFQAQLNFHEKRHSKVSQPGHSKPTPSRRSRRIINFGTPPKTDLSTRPFRVSRAFLRITNPELFERLEKEKKDALNASRSTSNDALSTGIGQKDESQTLVLNPAASTPKISSNLRIGSRPRPPSTPPQSLNVNAKDNSISIIDISDDDSDIGVIETSNNSSPIAGPSSSRCSPDSPKVPKRRQTEIDDIGAANMSSIIASPLATSTPKPKTSAQGALERPKSKINVEKTQKDKIKQPPLQVSLAAPKSKKTPSKQDAEQGKSNVPFVKKCPHCTRTNFANSCHYENHLEVHQGKRPFVCPFCNFGFKTDLKLLEHVSTKHSHEPTFECPTCSKENLTEFELQTHQCMPREGSTYIID